ncbi:MAG: CoxG family protein [Vicinamibacteria bacterium]
MIVEGTYTFKGPRATVWDLLQDPEVLVKAMPGAERLTRVGDDRFEGVMKVSVGPMSAAEFQMAVELVDKIAPERFGMRIDAKGGLGFARGTAEVTLTEPRAGETTMTYRSEMQIGGRIAAVGQRILDSAARMMTERGLQALQAELQARLGAGGGGR